MLISVEIQKFRNLEMLKFINVEVYISKTLDVFLNVLSIFQSCTHRGRTSKTRSSMPWVTCWHRYLGNCQQFKSTRMIWCSLTSLAFPVSRRATAKPWLFSLPSPIPSALALQSSGQMSRRWLLDSDLLFREHPSPFPPYVLFFLFH